MAKVVAIMAMSLDRYLADLNEGGAEVYEWYFPSGDVEMARITWKPCARVTLRR